MDAVLASRLTQEADILRKKQDYLNLLTAKRMLWDYRFFAKYGLGLDFPQINDPGVQQALGEFNEAVNTWIRERHFQRTRKNILIVWPRECAKSSSITTVLPAYFHQHDPEMAALIMSAEFEKMGKKFAASVKQHWQNPDNLLNGLRGIHDGRPGRKWSDERMVTSKRTKLHRTDPTLAVASIETGATSGHYDLGIIDDPTTEALVIKHGDKWHSKVWKQITDLNTVIRKDGLLVVVLTRYGGSDFVDRLKENVIKPAVLKLYDNLPDDFEQEWWKYGRYAGWTIIHRQAVSYEADGTEVYNFPEVWPKERIEAVRAQGVQGETFFATQLQNTPSARSDNPVTQEMIDRCQIEFDDVPKQAFNYLTMQMDTAWKDEEAYLEQRGDWNVIQIWAHWQGQVYLVWSWHGRVQEHQFMEAFVRGLQWAKLHGSRVSVCTYDKPTGGQGTNKHRFVSVAHAAGEACPRIIEINRSQKKTGAILNAIGFLQEGRVHVVKGLLGNEELFYEWMNIGYSAHDDHADAAKDVFHEEVYLGHGIATGAPIERRSDDWEPLFPDEDEEGEKDLSLNVGGIIIPMRRAS